MAMNDMETVALVAGGHTFGKAHGAADPGKYLGTEPEGADLEEQGFGWNNTFGSGKGNETITSGLEGAWTAFPRALGQRLLGQPVRLRVGADQEPGRCTTSGPPKNGAGCRQGARRAGSRTSATQPMMFTTDMALIMDPAYEKISRRYYEHPEEFADSFARAWFKLTHRDMGPVARYLGPNVPKEQLIWQDPLPAATYETISDADVESLKTKIMACGLTIPQLVSTAWASASTFRRSDKRGGANGSRIRLEPQKYWEVNQPGDLARALEALEGVQKQFNAENSGKQVSLADLIVLGGTAAVEQAAKAAGHDVKVAFMPGRVDATQAQTDVESFEVLEPLLDGFRNYTRDGHEDIVAEMMLDKANQLDLSAPEMTALVGGMRVLNANFGQTSYGVFTTRPETLTNDFFVNLLDMGTKWTKSTARAGVLDGKDRTSGALKWTGTVADLMFGSNSQLRALAEFYAASDAEQVFVRDFAAAWTKVMNLDRFDLA